ncbi:hypothetical protein Rsub_04177 [Raphidocelis subcapitata]|uniref:Amidohydrolase 3 domain-containing protein n=1 Tax=Raphidocelis subcapitata TaxID=307507 RepID=A0A2V0P2K8_9CHLO|nr:hypothetical protein Rsub_04177 [Raphidocelis subcapitata]|eukprot:GBF91437.1 hypothetical protein Rsub_04177 [Raphidocelis subcapitata]
MKAAPAPEAATMPAAADAGGPQPRRRRRRDATSTALLALSAAAALAAVFWPQLSPHLLRAAQSASRGGGVVDADGRPACPLGYTSANAAGAELPQGHPPVPGAAAAPARAPYPGQPRGARVWLRGDIWTGDEARPRARSMAVDRLTGEILQLDGEPEGHGEEVVDLGGAFVMPGIVDSHTHFIPAGLSLSAVDLRRAASREEFERAVAAAAERLGPDEWLLGGFWDDNLWGGELPDASWLDAASAGRPALLQRMDSHMALANTAALARAGVDASTPDPPDGAVDRGPGGAPTGVLREGAMRLVSRAVPPPSAGARRAAALAAAAYALERGVTSVVDFGRSPFAEQGASWSDLEEVYDHLAAEGKLPLRVYAFVPLEQWGAIATRVAAAGYAHPSGRLFVGGVKAFADGSLGSRTALMHEPYADAPSEAGARMIDLDRLAREAAAADAAGLQVAVHAIGDRAVDDVLSVFEAVAASKAGAARPRGAPGGAAPWRALRMEHAQHISGPRAAARFGALAASAVPVANPQHLATDAPMLDGRLGPARATPERAFAWPLLSAAGARVAAGSDWPVVDVAPLEGVAAAAARAEQLRARGGGSDGGGGDAEAAARDALLMHTAASADAAFVMGRLVGRLVPGRRADFAVLSASPLELGARADAARVLKTFVDGRCAWGCGGSGAAAAAV